MKQMLLMVLSALCLPFGIRAAAQKQSSVVLPASEATFTPGKGISFAKKMASTYYDEASGCIDAISDKGEIRYTVPEGVDGVFDLYLNVSKIQIQYTSQPFCFTINDGEPFLASIDCDMPADAISAYLDDGEEYNVGEPSDTGRFLVCEQIHLQAGDRITVIATYGAKDSKIRGNAYPAVGDMELFPAGTAVGIGYGREVPEAAEPDPNDPLSGLTILWLGSSVTYGAQSGGHYSMADAIADRHPGTVCEKYAISGTTLVNDSSDSYVARLKLINKDKKPDLVVVQLSTNDATTGKSLGEVSDSFDPADFDDTCVAGAMETIIAYVKETFGCPVAFYTGSYFESPTYPDMVKLLLEIQEKWGIGVVNMYDDEELNAIYGTELYAQYIANDGIHPHRSGYIEWWTPFIERELSRYLNEIGQ